MYDELISYAKSLIKGYNLIDPEDLVNEAYIRDKELNKESYKTVKAIYYELKTGYVSNNFSDSQVTVQETNRCCQKCQELLPIGAFAEKSVGIIREICKECHSARSNKWYIENKKRVQQRNFLNKYHILEPYLKARLKQKGKQPTRDHLDLEKIAVLRQRTNYDKIINASGV